MKINLDKPEAIAHTADKDRHALHSGGTVGDGEISTRGGWPSRSDRTP